MSTQIIGTDNSIERFFFSTNVVIKHQICSKCEKDREIERHFEVAYIVSPMKNGFR
jgi:hypothetical protein